MEFKSVSAKLSRDEVTQFKAYCKMKGVTPSSLIRELILREIEIPIPHTIAGRNRVVYARGNDGFSWTVELDNGGVVVVMKNVSYEFLSELVDIIGLALIERNSFIGKIHDSSVPIPSNLIRRNLSE